METKDKILVAVGAGVFLVGAAVIYKNIFALRNLIINYQTNGDTMKLTLKRTRKSASCTIGELYINGKRFCYTLEDTDRGLKSSMSLDQIKKAKVNGETCIPAGTYAVDMDTVSPKYQARGANSTYAKIGFKLPRLLNVPGYEGVLMHIGNYPKDTEGCILVGEAVARSGEAINSSTNAFWALYNELDKAHKSGQKITITIA